jgi:hypothetical protein
MKEDVAGQDDLLPSSSAIGTLGLRVFASTKSYLRSFASLYAFIRDSDLISRWFFYGFFPAYAKAMAGPPKFHEGGSAPLRLCASALNSFLSLCSCPFAVSSPVSG